MPARKKEKKEISLAKGKFNTPAEVAKEKYDQMVVEDEMLVDDFDSGSEPSLISYLVWYLCFLENSTR